MEGWQHCEECYKGRVGNTVRSVIKAGLATL